MNLLEVFLTMKEGATMKPTRTLRSDIAPIYNMEGGIEGWEGAVMFEADYQVDPLELERIASTFTAAFAEVNEWSVEIICTGLFKLIPREWNTILFDNK